MFEYDAMGDNTDWQQIYKSLSKFLGQLYIATLKHGPILPGQFHRQLDIQIAQAQLILKLVTSHSERLDHEDVLLGEAFGKAFGMLGELWGPWLSIGQIRQLHQLQLRAYAELLQAYIDLLEEARHEASEPESSHATRKKYTVTRDS